MQAIAQREQAAEALTTASEASWSWSAQAVGFNEIEADWRWFEQHGELTPYQSIDWVRSYAADALETDGATLALVVIRSAQARALAFGADAVFAPGDAQIAALASNSGLGPNLADGNPLFHASHRNNGTGGGSARQVSS
jgi:CelD/BcsL family acetyltransferase involved in cellulose biosynthesis